MIGGDIATLLHCCRFTGLLPLSGKPPLWLLNITRVHRTVSACRFCFISFRFISFFFVRQSLKEMPAISSSALWREWRAYNIP